MDIVKVKILSVDAKCPNCQHVQNVDSSEFDTDKIVSFTEYQTQCDKCGVDYMFSLDVFE